MRLEQLEMVIAIAENKSMQKASELLHTSIQNISKSIRQLESELGVQLFTRTKNGVFPTIDGQWVYEQATIIIQSSNLIKQHFSDFMPVSNIVFDSNTLSFLTCNAFEREINSLLSNFYKKYPKVQISTAVMEASTIVNELLTNSIYLSKFDMITTLLDKKSVHFLKNLSDTYSIYSLYATRISVHCGVDSPLAKLSEVSYKDIHLLPFISLSSEFGLLSQLYSIMEQNGFPLQIALTTSRPPATNFYLTKNNLYSLCTSDMQPTENTKIIPIKENIQILMLLLFRKNLSSNSPASYFRKMLFSNYQKTATHLY